MAWASQGKIDLNFEDSGGVNALLYNFDIGASYLKPQHKSWLDSKVVARFKGQPVNIAVWGWASRSGNYGWNQTVALRRADAVAYYLILHGFPNTAFKVIDGQVDNNSDDDPNDETWRSATIFVSKSPFDWLE